MILIVVALYLFYGAVVTYWMIEKTDAEYSLSLYLGMFPIWPLWLIWFIYKELR